MKITSSILNSKMAYYENNLFDFVDGNYYINEPQHFYINTRDDQIHCSYSVDNFGLESMIIDSRLHGQSSIHGRNGSYQVW